MRHSNKNKKFGRNTGPRAALMRSLTLALFTKHSITTTEARAKSLRPIAEKMITRAKNMTLANRRLLVSSAGGDEKLVGKIEKVATVMKKRAGGYTRIVKLGQRKGDASPMATIQFVESAE